MDYLAKEDIIDYIAEKIKGIILSSEKNIKFLQSNALLYCVVLLLALKIVTILVSINFPQNIFFADITKSTLENLVNQTRQADGLAPLIENQKLNEAAQLKAENMVQNQYFNHTSPSGISPWFWFAKAGYNYKYAGENLAIGFFDSKEVYDAWLNSPSHKANILNPNYKEIGTAVLNGFGQNNTIVVVQEFGSQLPAKIETVKSNNTKPVATEQKTNTPLPTFKTNEPTPTTAAGAINEKVLSQTAESTDSLGVAKGASNNLFSRVLNYIMYNYDGLLQNIVYGVSLVIIGLLLTIIFFNSNITFKKQLIARSILIVVLLSATILLSSPIIVSLIPHKILI